MILGEEL